MIPSGIILPAQKRKQRTAHFNSYIEGVFQLEIRLLIQSFSLCALVPLSIFTKISRAR